MCFYNTLAINNPNPVFSKEFEANFGNILGDISGFIAVPVSFTLTIT
jgi:hypothetical protein